jgi:hypothetical protein
MPVMRLTTTGRPELMRDRWFPIFLDQNLALLKGTEEQDAKDWINKHVSMKPCGGLITASTSPKPLRENIPNHPHWAGSPMQPLFDRTGQDEEHAGVRIRKSRLPHGSLALSKVIAIE